MASGLNDPKLLYAIPGVSAYHLANGKESPLTPAGPQTLSLLMVPTASPFADLSIGDKQSGTSAGKADGNGVAAAVTGGQDGGALPHAEEDFYLHLHLPPELDLPLPATTQIYHKPPTSYLIPRWDLGRNSGVFTRIEFPPAGSRKGLQEDVDTFETILAQCTAFLERIPPPPPPPGKASAARKNGGGGSSSGNKVSSSTSASVPSAAAVARASAAAGRDGSSAVRSSSTSRQQSGYHSEKKQRPPGYKRSSSASSSSRSRTAMSEELPAYNPAAFKPGEAYATGSASSQAGGQIVLIDEEDGSIIGELGEGFKVVEDKALTPGSKEPVEITLPTEDVPSISVAPAPSTTVAAATAKDQYDAELHPAYKKSFLVANAAAASRLIVATSEVVSKALQSQADRFAEKAVPASKPITFQPATHEHIRRINTLSANAAGLSAKAVGQVGKVAQNFGAKLAGHKAQSSVSSINSEASGKSNGSRKAPSGYGPDGQPLDDFRPGLLNKSLMAFSTVADGIEQAGRHLLDTSSNAATTVVASKWGSEAGEVTRHLTGGIKNVGLVYIDVTGVSRRAILKSVAKGMVVGHVPGGGDLIVGGTAGDDAAAAAAAAAQPSSSSSRSSSVSGTTSPPPALPPNKPSALPPNKPSALPSRPSASADRAREESRNGNRGGGGGSGSASGMPPVSRTRSTNDFSDNNPYRGK